MTAEVGNGFYDILSTFDDRPALIDGSRVVAYRELASLADDSVGGLSGNRKLVFLEAGNSVAAIATYLGCLRAGHLVYLFGDGDHAQLDALVERYRPNSIVSSGADGMVFDQLHDRVLDLHPASRVLLSTSGSTGSPKFVKLSDTNINANASAIADYLELTPADRAITSLKFNYSYGMSVINSHIMAGASLVLTDLSVTAPDFWTRVNEAGCTSFAGVPYTFEILAKSGDWDAAPSLRYVTQAGGKLAPALVTQFAERGARNGWQFFVMYGQTEAAPRMAYLPPEMAAANPGAIGRAIPGGRLFLLDAQGETIVVPDVEGELAYAGPNVMMGYAGSDADLAGDETPPYLKTGDIAVQGANGLYSITGRSARIIKPFGLRLNLDELQDQVRETCPGAAVSGSDEVIVIAIPADDIMPGAFAATLANRYHLPSFMIEVVRVGALPLLPNGKVDYRRITALATTSAAGGRELRKLAPLSLGTVWNTVTSGAFYRRALFEAGAILGIATQEWQDVRTIFQVLTGAQQVDEESSFASLAGDSLSYVQTSLALESYLGKLPDNWTVLTVADLEELRSDEPVF